MAAKISAAPAHGPFCTCAAAGAVDHGIGAELCGIENFLGVLVSRAQNLGVRGGRRFRCSGFR